MKLTRREEPIYNIGAVARMTGVPATTLRVWERRYGFPVTMRTSGGHRLYSEHEVNRIRWVKSHIDAGMQTGQAIQALQKMKAQDVLSPELAPHVQRPVSLLDTLHLDPLREEIGAALYSHNLFRADYLFNEAATLHAPEALILEVVRPLLSAVGDRWEDGGITVATEHLASHYLRQRLQLWLRTGTPPYVVPPVVLACAPGEWHEGGLLILGALIRRRRWPVVYLGQSVPLPDLASFVREENPLAVVFVATMEPAAEALLTWPEWMPEVAEREEPLVAFGGRIFSEQPAWRERVPGHFLGKTLDEGVESLERVLRQSVTQEELALQASSRWL